MLTAAIPLDETTIPLAGPLIASLGFHDFDNILILWTSEKPAPGIDGAVRVVRTHPDFVIETAVHEVMEGWVFVFYPGEQLDPEGALRLPVNGESRTRLNGHIRGYRLGFGNEDVFDGGDLLLGAVMPTRAEPVEAREYSRALTVILPTWRPGGLDVTLGALAKQTFKNFEVIIVDALSRFRSSLVPRNTCLGLKLRSVTHVPPDNDIFPLSSHSRFRNTAIRRAKGERLVFLSEYAVPPPDFLEKHAALPVDTIGLCQWVRTTIRPEALKFKRSSGTSWSEADTVWGVIASAERDENMWSVFKPGVDPAGEVIGRFPSNPHANEQFNTQEYLAHYKADSVPTHLARAVNGWDEEFDGRGDYADVDFTLRLLWAGARMYIIPECETPVLDAHIVAVAPLTDRTRNNKVRLLKTRGNRMVRCVHGLEAGIRDD